MTKAKRIALIALAALLVALAIAAAYHAGYQRGAEIRYDGMFAVCGDWTLFANTPNGPAYVLDTRMTYDENGIWTGYGDGFDGTVRITTDDGRTLYELPLYVW